jgi:hypothetical protein
VINIIIKWISKNKIFDGIRLIDRKEKERGMMRRRGGEEHWKRDRDTRGGLRKEEHVEARLRTV